MIDFHTHILPGLDDGSRNIKETEELLREEARQGVQQIVATPHFYADQISVEEFLRRRAESIKKTEDWIQEQNETPAAPFPIPKLRCGAEVYFFPGMGRAEKLPKLCVEGTDLILLEMPFTQWNEEVLQEVKNVIRNQHLRVVLAHVERYPKFQKNTRIFEQMLALPLTIQLNGGSFLNERSKRKFCLNILKNCDQVILGSDTHNLQRRPPNLEAARKVVREKLGQQRVGALDETIEKLLSENQSA